MITISVAYATAECQVEMSLKVEASCTVALAIRRSGLLQQFSQLRLDQVVVGIFSRMVTLDALVQDGDRIEIYRPLVIDPKQARKLRAQRKFKN